MKSLSEADLAAGYRPKTWGGKRTSDAVLSRERLPVPVRGVHNCLRCVLTLIPDSNPSSLCRFCARS